jgi:NTE family protein
MTAERAVVVLSGGGAKTAAHVGAVKALAERDITPSHYVATSMGAVVAACFASGLTYPEVLRRITSISRRDVAVFSPSALLGPFAGSLLERGPLIRTIERLIPVQSFSEMQTPLTITAVDVDSGELVLFGSGGDMEVPLVDALYASCALPLYYPPAVIGGREFADGGLRSVLPLEVASEFDPSILFAVDVGPSLYSEPPERETPFPAMLRRHGQAMRILMAAQTEAKISRWKKGPVPLVLVRPVRDREATFALESVVRFVEEGYRAAHLAVDSYLT